ncbi:MAG: hypothetical protein IM638_13435 [Bacteroidetes bacterium]|nr:hypothetical protein [Bacteroidota bacterium]
MKLLFTLLNCLVFITAVAQINLKFEAFGGMNMTRVYNKARNYNWSGQLQQLKVHPQLGGQAGAWLSVNKVAFSPLIGIQFSRVTCLGSLTKDNYYYSTSANAFSYQVYYMRWDIIRTDFMLMAQIALGVEKNIRLFGGVMLSSNLANLSKQRYWKISSPFNPVFVSENISSPLIVSRINTFLCGGISLPVPETKWSLALVWRICRSPMNRDYSLSESGMQVSVAYDLSGKVFRKNEKQPKPIN